MGSLKTNVFLKFLTGMFILSFSTQVLSNSGGISGRSKQISTCNSCHGGANFNASISLEGDTSVASGSTNSIIVKLTHTGAGSGFNLSASSGNLEAGSGSRKLSGELTHNAPRNNSGGSTSWTIQWTAPMFSGSETLFVCGNAVNLNSATSGDENSTPCTTMSISVVAVNTAPIAVNDNANSNEDDEVIVDVLANDSDSDGTLQPNSVTISAPAQNGNTSINAANGRVTYSPNNNFNGTDSFSYTVEDNDGVKSNLATVNISIASINDPPITANDNATTNIGKTVVIDVLANDNDIDGIIVVDTISITTEAANGTSNIDSNSGKIIYTPNDSFKGTDSIKYQVSDDQGLLSNIATVTIVIAPVNTRIDYDGDGKADVLWRNLSTGQNWLWTMNGLLTSGSQSLVSIDMDWNIVGQGDFDGDGKSDILWRNNQTGLNYIWMMDGFTLSERRTMNTVVDLAWQIKAVADFNGDGKNDILWHHQQTGQTYVYLMDGFQMISSNSVSFVDDLNWQIEATADVNADERSDVIWRNQSSGRNYIWLMDGASIKSGYELNTVSIDWDIVGAGDLNSDGTGDIVWRNTIDGRNWAYLMKGGQINTSRQINTVNDTDWQIKSIADFDGDGKADIFWHNQNTGLTYIYLMDGTLISERASLNTIDTAWQVISN